MFTNPSSNVLPVHSLSANVASDQCSLAVQFGLCRSALRRWAPGTWADHALAFAVPRLMSLALLCGFALAGAASLVG